MENLKTLIIAAGILLLLRMCILSASTPQEPSTPNIASTSVVVATPTAESEPTKALTKALDIIVIPSGKLNEYISVYHSYDEVYVTKKDGSVETWRNDLEELCRDWLYFRDQIVKHTANGDTEKADEARVAFQEINTWLNEYDENDVGVMLSIIGE